MTPLLVGETLLNQFRVENMIGAGGMATIYRVWDMQRGVPMAMKVLNPEFGSDPAFIARFQREARALQSLSHPHIVPFYGLFRTQNLTFLIEQYIDGPSLDEVLRRRGTAPLPIWEVLVYFKALYTSLGYAHAQGIIHCDVKPGNVLIDQGGQVYLTDFGIARYAEQTGVTTTIGTPIYMAPEQILDERVSPETDVYSLGIMLYEMFTGRRPFRPEDEYPEEAGTGQGERLRYAHLNLLPPDPRSINPNLPPELAGVVLQAIEKDPRQRFPNMQAMAEAMFSALSTRFEALPGRVRPPDEQANDSTVASQTMVWPGEEEGEALLPAKRRLHTLSPRLLVAAAAAALVLMCLLIGTRLVGVVAASLRGDPPAVATDALPGAGTPSQPMDETTPEPLSTETPALAANTPQPTWAPEGDFSLSGQIVIVQREGGQDRLARVDVSSGQRLPFYDIPKAQGASAPQWSPDGARLAWISQYGGRSHVQVLDVEAQQAQELAAGEAFARVSSPAWLGNGAQVSFWGFDQNVNWLAIADATSGGLVDQFKLPVYRNLFVWNWVSGQLAFVQNPNQRYDVVISKSPLSVEMSVAAGREAYAPSWAPGGEWLAFQAEGQPGGGVNEIWIVRADGSDLQQVTFSPTGTWSRAPTWSPDGRFIAYVSDRAGSIGADYGELFVVEVSSAFYRQITNTGGAVYDWRPAWRPK